MPFLLGFYRRLDISYGVVINVLDRLITSDNYVFLLLMQLMILY